MLENDVSCLQPTKQLLKVLKSGPWTASHWSIFSFKEFISDRLNSFLQNYDAPEASGTNF